MKVAIAFCFAAMTALAAARSCNNRNTCKNGGLCQEINSSPGFRCVCAAGFGGDRCQNVETPQNWASMGDCEYLFVTQPVKSWGDAQAACNVAGGSLANFDDAETEASVAELTQYSRQSVGRWIGMKATKKHKFYWYNQAGRIEVDRQDYLNWFPTYPGFDKNQCVIQDFRDGQIGWATHKCREEKRYICQRCNNIIPKRRRRRRRRRSD